MSDKTQNLTATNENLQSILHIYHGLMHGQSRLNLASFASSWKQSRSNHVNLFETLNNDAANDAATNSRLELLANSESLKLRIMNTDWSTT